MVFYFFVVFILIGGIVFLGESYWKFAVKGEEMSAIVTNIRTHQSGKHHTTHYVYSLEATIDGVLVKDSFDAGTYHAPKIGDTVSVYRTRESSPSLALTHVVNEEPFWMFGVVLFNIFLIFALIRQRKLIASGRMKISQLPKKMQRKRILALRNESDFRTKKEGSTGEKLTYSIGGSLKEPKNTGNDGSDYRP